MSTTVTYAELVAGYRPFGAVVALDSIPLGAQDFAAGPTELIEIAEPTERRRRSVPISSVTIVEVEETDRSDVTSKFVLPAAQSGSASGYTRTPFRSGGKEFLSTVFPEGTFMIGRTYAVEMPLTDGEDTAVLVTPSPRAAISQKAVSAQDRAFLRAIVDLRDAGQIEGTTGTALRKIDPWKDASERDLQGIKGFIRVAREQGIRIQPWVLS